ncbi:MAG TPA: hypothetical protein PKZ75_05025 [Bacteroidia bacterium]|nr:hypothetical protein [Bacteroidia bacterium]
MKKNAFILFCIFFATVTACKKSGFGEVEGVVRDSYTNQPISGGRVNLIWFDGTYSGNKNWEKSTTADGNGHYKISFYKKKNRIYDLVSSSDSYWGQSNRSLTVDQRKTNCDIYLDPIAYIQFRVKNNTANQVKIVIGDYVESFFVQPFSDTSSIKQHRANGNGETVISWQLGQFPNEVSYFDKVYIYSGGGAVVTHTININ